MSSLHLLSMGHRQRYPTLGVCVCVSPSMCFPSASTQSLNTDFMLTSFPLLSFAFFSFYCLRLSFTAKIHPSLSRALSRPLGLPLFFFVSVSCPPSVLPPLSSLQQHIDPELVSLWAGRRDVIASAFPQPDTTEMPSSPRRSLSRPSASLKIAVTQRLIQF